MAKKSVWRKNKDEIIWHVVNSLLAGSLVLLGGLTSGTITGKAIGYALITSAIIGISKFRDYWTNEENEYTTKIFNFT